MKARTQIIIGSVGIIAVSVLLCLVVAIRGAAILRPHAWLWLPGHSLSFPSILVLTLVLTSVYGIGLISGNLSLAERVYRVWWILVMSISALELYNSFRASHHGGTLLLQMILLWAVLWGPSSFFQWVGLGGLERKVEAQGDQAIKDAANEYKQWRASQRAHDDAKNAATGETLPETGGEGESVPRGGNADI